MNRSSPQSHSQGPTNVPVSPPPGTETAKSSKQVEKWLQTQKSLASEADLHRKPSSALCSVLIHTPAKSSFSDYDVERCCAPVCASATEFEASIRNDEKSDPPQVPLCGYQRRKAPEGIHMTDEMLADLFMQESSFANQQVVSCTFDCVVLACGGP